MNQFSELWRSRPLSGTVLKRIACISMLLDHLGASLLENGLLKPWLSVWNTAPAVIRQLYALDQVLRLAGRIAFPLYCFLLVEGFVHTHSLRRYAARLFAFALLSEAVFDYAFFGALTWRYQNVYWTLLFGLCCLCVLRWAEEHGKTGLLLRLCIIVPWMLLAEVCAVDYQAFGVALIALLYILRTAPERQCLLGAVATSFEITAPLAFLLCHFYSGGRGRCARWEQYAFYAFYPVHLAVLAVLVNLVFPAVSLL